MRRYRIAVIPGNGIGKEVIPAGLEALAALAGARRSITPYRFPDEPREERTFSSPPCWVMSRALR